MNRKMTCILVHGYLGSPTDLAPLAVALRAEGFTVDDEPLPGHTVTGRTPEFDTDGFLAHLFARMDRCEGTPWAILGHSTGGSLVLAALDQLAQQDAKRLSGLALVALAATPLRIDAGYPARWSSHMQSRSGVSQPAMHDLGALAVLVNGLARKAPCALPAPALILQGEMDELVPAGDAHEWLARLKSPARLAPVAAAGHHLFTARPCTPPLGACRALVVDSEKRPRRGQFLTISPGNSRTIAQESGKKWTGGDVLQPTIPKPDRLLGPFPSPNGLALDLVVRALADAMRPREGHVTLPAMAGFTSSWPDRAYHLAHAPAARRLQQNSFQPGEEARQEPTLANIEITTRCTLGCQSCARTQLKRTSRHMSQERFMAILAALPHAWRIQLVGLGEPLLHPQVEEFIRLAAAQRRQIGLVTNAMDLDVRMAQALASSGLARITFSLDAMDDALADVVRRGSDMSRIRANISDFMEIKRRQAPQMSTAVFTALTPNTVGELAAIIDFAVQNGIDALMLSDLNFPSNQERSLRQCLGQDQARALRTALRDAAMRRFPVLTVRGLEEYALNEQYFDYLALRGDQIVERSLRHAHCLSPWQTVPVNVDGQATLCDCLPEARLGDITQLPLNDWWNGNRMKTHRRAMLSDNPPRDCLACPRF